MDVDAQRVAQLNAGESYVEDVPTEALNRLVDDGLVAATTDYDELREADAILDRAPDAPVAAARARPPHPRLGRGQIATRLRPGHLVVLESTTYPGTTREQVQPLLEAGSGLTAGKDFHLAFSPERVDPGREDWTTKNVPKVVGGIDEASTEAAAELYGSAIERVHRVSSPEAAELTKLLENIFRSVNIALVNELAQLCDRMDIDVWEVVDAAATKPFGFMSFQPGPGPRRPLHPDRSLLPHLEGTRVRLLDRVHRARGKVNESMPYFCRSIVSQALNHARQRSLRAPASSSSASRTSRTSPTRASPPRSSSSACCATRARRSPTTIRTSRRSTSTAWR